MIAARRLEPRLRSRWLSGFILLDVVVFTLLSVVAVLPGLGSGGTAAASHGDQGGQRSASSPGPGARAAPDRGTGAAGPFRDLRSWRARRARAARPRFTRPERPQRHPIGSGLLVHSRRPVRLGDGVTSGHGRRAGRAQPAGHRQRDPRPARYHEPAHRPWVLDHRWQAALARPRAAGHRQPRRRPGPPRHLVLRHPPRRVEARGARRGRQTGRGNRNSDRAGHAGRLDALVRRGRAKRLAAGDPPAAPRCQRGHDRPGRRQAFPARPAVHRRTGRPRVRRRWPASERPRTTAVGIRRP